MKKKSGLADSPFFEAATIPEEREPIAVFPQVDPSPAAPSPVPATKQEPLINDAMVSRYHGTMIENIRRCVKEFGKEAATHRFTLAEKRAISSIIHSLEMQGVRTTENEIARIAINYVINEYNQKGKDSILGLVLQALNK
jgi:hypothetical protein